MKYEINSNIGVVREENQDRAQVFENDIFIIAILCDGMGGHFGGSLASSITIEAFRKKTQNVNKKNFDVYVWFKNAIKKAKQDMLNESGNDLLKRDMGTTVTAAIVFKDSKKIFVFNIGDSRTYLFDGLLHQITTDHNLMNHMIHNEGTSEFEAAKMPGAQSLTSALGPNKKTNIEAFVVEHKSLTKTLVLTSDGIHDFITKPKFEMILSSKNSLKEKTDELIKEAIKGGSTDNLTVIIVEVE